MGLEPTSPGLEGLGPILWREHGVEMRTGLEPARPGVKTLLLDRFEFRIEVVGALGLEPSVSPV